MSQVYHEIMRLVEHMTMRQWLLVLLGALAIGTFCMRGFSSRHHC